MSVYGGVFKPISRTEKRREKSRTRKAVQLLRVMVGLGLKDEWKNGEKGNKEIYAKLFLAQFGHFSILININKTKFKK